jgi:hypothetical protein
MRSSALNPVTPHPRPGYRAGLARRWAAVLSTLALLLSTGIFATPTSAHAVTAGSCWGPVACAGFPPTADDCLSSGYLVQDQKVPRLGDIDLFESGLCGIAWARLSIATYPGPGVWTPGQLAEIFYVPPQGGPEQFATAQWDLSASDYTYTTSVPEDGSVRACAGNPAGNTADYPFDEDPLAQGVLQDSTNTPSTFYGDGACTMWH